MANEEQLTVLREGVSAWNQWRGDHLAEQVDLGGANLTGADLREARLWGADLTRADLTRADLTRADLTGATLTRADLRDVNLTDTSFRGTRLAETVLGHLDLSQAHHLDSVLHMAPSYLSIDTVYRSQGKIPEVFLRGAGAPDTFITFVASLVAAGQPIQYYSCFISYSSRDQEFADRLYADLQHKGVRCWFAPHDLPIGEEIVLGIDRAIRAYDKLLLILSHHSVASTWVREEVMNAFRKEREQGRLVLFPVRLDDAIKGIKEDWPAMIYSRRNVGDFTRWHEHTEYQRAFQRVLRDLQPEAPAQHSPSPATT